MKVTVKELNRTERYEVGNRVHDAPLQDDFLVFDNVRERFVTISTSTGELTGDRMVKRVIRRIYNMTLETGGWWPKKVSEEAVLENDPEYRQYIEFIAKTEGRAA